ncbi:MAG: MFS transporter [Chloroflexota bacterium]|nr:MFS transporter [Chloroflexota bacterium]
MTSGARTPARTQSSWPRMLALFSLAAFVEVTAYGQLTAFTPTYLSRLGVPDADLPRWIALTTAVPSALGICLLPFWGALADRYGRKPLVVRSFAATGTALAFASLATNAWTFFASRSISAFALGNSGLMMTTLAESAPPSRIGFAYGILNGAGPLGAVVGPLFGGPLVDRYGVPALLALEAFLLLMVVLTLALGYRDPWSRPAHVVPVLRSAFGGAALLWRSPRLRWLFPAVTCVFAGWMLTLAYTPLVVAHVHTGPGLATAIGLVLGAGGAVTVVASPGIGALADRFGLFRTYFAMGALTALSWTLPWTFRDFVPFLVANALASGIGSGPFSLSFNLIARSTTDATRARVMTFSYLPLNLALVVGPALGGIAAALDPFAIYPTSIALQLVGLVFVALALRRPL